MKRFRNLSMLFLFAAILVTITSCSKDDEDKPTNPLTGTWKIKTIVTSFTDSEGKPFGSVSEDTFSDGEASFQFTENNKMYYTNSPDDDEASGTYAYDKTAATITLTIPEISETEVFHITELSSSRLNMYTNYTYTTGGEEITAKVEYGCSR